MRCTGVLETGICLPDLRRMSIPRPEPYIPPGRMICRWKYLERTFSVTRRSFPEFVSGSNSELSCQIPLRFG